MAEELEGRRRHTFVTPQQQRVRPRPASTSTTRPRRGATPQAEVRRARDAREERNMDHAQIEAAYWLLKDQPDFEVLRRIEVETGRTGGVAVGESLIAIVLDIEATSKDPKTAQIVELAMRRLRFDGRGVICEIGMPFGWLRDPNEALGAEVSRLTGLTDKDLAGQTIDEGMVFDLTRNCDVIISHGASFDRPIFERHLPRSSGCQWACSLTEIDWGRRGFSSRRLGDLLRRGGHFHQAHRAGPDTDALIHMLNHGVMFGDSALRELIDTASQGGWRVLAVGAHYDRRGDLAERGYRWNRDDEVWWRYVSEADRLGEEFWLARRIYSAEARPQALEPIFEAVTWAERHA